jgi:hypothetical protein
MAGAKSSLLENVQYQDRQVPSALGGLLSEIERSKSLLDLGADWDGAGSPAYELRTWERATDFLLRVSLFLWQKQQVQIAVPTISPGPTGTIDLHWQSPGRELLLNIPSEPDALGSFSLDDGEGGASSRGEIRLDPADAWLLVAVAVE